MAVVMAAAAVLLAAEAMAMMVAMAAVAVAGAAATAVPAAATCGGLVCLSLRLRLLGQQHLLGGKNTRAPPPRPPPALHGAPPPPPPPLHGAPPPALHLCLCCTAQLVLPRRIRLLMCDDDLQQGRHRLEKGLQHVGIRASACCGSCLRSSPPGGPMVSQVQAMVTQIVASIKAGSGSSSRRADPDTRAWLKSRGCH